MKTLHQTKQLVNEENRMRLEVVFPWDQCSLARFYDYLDHNYERGGLFDIMEVFPLDLNKGDQTINVCLIVDISDALEEFPEEVEGDESLDHADLAVAP